MSFPTLGAISMVARQTNQICKIKAYLALSFDVIWSHLNNFAFFQDRVDVEIEAFESETKSGKIG